MILGSLCLALCLEGPVFAEKKEFAMTPETFPPSGETLRTLAPDFLSVSTVSLIAWDTLARSEYESAYTRLSDPEFLSRFSMKRGYPLAPWFPLLFPNTEADLSKLSEERMPDGELFSKKRKEVQHDADLTIHEIHQEQFLVPALRWSRENGLPIAYRICTADRMPVSFLLEDGFLIRRVFSDGDPISDFLARTIARQCGQPDLEPGSETVLLLPDDFSCGELRVRLESDGAAWDCMSEFQLPYVAITVRQGRNGEIFAEVSHGPAVWKEIRLGEPKERFSEPAQEFLKRFESLGGIVKECIECPSDTGGPKTETGKKNCEDGS